MCSLPPVVSIGTATDRQSLTTLVIYKLINPSLNPLFPRAKLWQKSNGTLTTIRGHPERNLNYTVAVHSYYTVIVRQFLVEFIQSNVQKLKCCTYWWHMWCFMHVKNVQCWCYCGLRLWSSLYHQNFQNTLLWSSGSSLHSTVSSHTIYPVPERPTTAKAIRLAISSLCLQRLRNCVCSLKDNLKDKIYQWLRS